MFEEQHFIFHLETLQSSVLQIQQFQIIELDSWIEQFSNWYEKRPVLMKDGQPEMLAAFSTHPNGTAQCFQNSLFYTRFPASAMFCFSRGYLASNIVLFSFPFSPQFTFFSYLYSLQKITCFYHFLRPGSFIINGMCLCYSVCLGFPAPLQIFPSYTHPFFNLFILKHVWY